MVKQLRRVSELYKAYKKTQKIPPHPRLTKKQRIKLENKIQKYKRKYD